MKFNKQGNRLAKASARPLMMLAALSMALTPAIITTGVSYAQSSTQLFNISDSGGGNKQPASCDQSALFAKNKEILNQITELNNTQQAKLNDISAQQKALQPGQDAHALQAQQDQVLADGQAQLASLKAQQAVIQKATQGPSDQCKRDSMANAVAEMSNVQATLNGSAVTDSFNTIDSMVAKIESLEPALQKNGVNNQDMTTIKNDVASVKSNTATLRNFMDQMKNKSVAFIAQAQADPIGTYNAMQTGDGPLAGVSGNTRSAMTNLVNSFTSLVNLFTKLSGTAG